MKSVEKTWEGFLVCPKVLHGDWGFTLPLDSDHSKARVLVVTSTQDSLGRGMADFLVQNYQNASLKVVEGGHIGALYHLDEIWAQFVL